jgi:2-polyprenyl-3-methyl-5-hydroxy-6-metoxy-1,4-benzoquinol methylase
MSEGSLDSVRMAYRLFLNREPESSAVVEAKAAACPTYEELRRLFVSSFEFQSYLRSLNPELFRSINSEFYSSYFQKPAAVEIDVPQDVLEKLLRRIRAQWRELGERDPYWSVLTDDGFRIKNMDSSKLAAFYETGRGSAQLIELFRERTGAVLRHGVCLELGCGVGRVTAHLAQQFDRVIATDISPGNLALCERYMKKMGMKNVRTVLLESPEQLLELGSFDFFYSVIVLQHNPPPVQKVLLSNILSRIQPGGACLFQTPSNFPDYSFSTEKYLSSDVQEIDMHCLPKVEVLNILRENKLQIRDVEIDPWIGAPGSYTYFATK